MPSQIVKYQRKISGPITDRIDMHVDVDEVLHGKLLSSTPTESSQEIRLRVASARKLQAKRFGSSQKTNSDMTNQDIKKIGRLSKQAKELLDQAASKLQISARSYMRSIKVARTIADLENSAEILPEHISEALQYRRRNLSL